MASREPPRSFKCPITLDVMSDPVLCSKSGYTYERSAIENALRSNPVDPLTRAPITRADLVPNRALKDQIDLWRSGGGESPTGTHQASTIDPRASSTSSRVVVPEAVEGARISLSANIFPPSVTFCDAPILSISLAAEESSRAETRVLAIVIDTSGSMGDAAKPAAPGAEEDGLSRLDLAKHSALTLIEAMG